MSVGLDPIGRTSGPTSISHSYHWFTTDRSLGHFRNCPLPTEDTSWAAVLEFDPSQIPKHPSYNSGASVLVGVPQLSAKLLILTVERPSYTLFHINTHSEKCLHYHRSQHLQFSLFSSLGGTVSEHQENKWHSWIV